MTTRDGDQVSLDCNDPEGSVFMLQEKRAAQQGRDEDGGDQQIQQEGYALHAPSKLPYPWEQLADQNICW